MRNIYTIIKKELKRFFTDYRMILTLVSPGIIIFVLYSLMGGFMSGMFETDDKYEYQVVVINEPSEDHFKTFVTFDHLPNNVNIIEASESNEYYFDLIENNKLDLFIIYPDNFYSDTIAYDPLNGDPLILPPKISIYYNLSKTESQAIYDYYLKTLELFKDDISNKFTVDSTNIAKEESVAILLITSLVPFLLILFLFSGAMSVSIEAIAGEKERGTIATVLATPIKRSELVLGKVLALSLASLVGATSSFLGLMLSLPKLIGGTGDINFNIYGFGEYALLFLVIATTTLLYVVLISIISTFSKSVKEASGMSAIFMIFNMVISVTSMGGKVNPNTWSYLIPVYNSLQAITSILSMEVNVLNLGITVISNVLYISFGVYVLSQMFNSEKIMFNK